MLRCDPQPPKVYPLGHTCRSSYMRSGIPLGTALDKGACSLEAAAVAEQRRIPEGDCRMYAHQDTSLQKLEVFNR